MVTQSREFIKHLDLMVKEYLMFLINIFWIQKSVEKWSIKTSMHKNPLH